MIDSLSAFTEALSHITKHLEKELQAVHLGRATPAILDSVRVEAYGEFVPVTSVASIQVQPPYTLIIQPWDQSLMRALERALQQANLGANPAVDKNLIRLTFQAPTEERRVQLAKQVEQMLEHTKVSAKGPREEYLKYIKQVEKEGSVSQDKSRSEQEEMQEILQNTTKHWQELIQAKVAEIHTI